MRDSLGPWLHQVACRTASCLRGAVVRRRKHEQRRALLAGTGRVDVDGDRRRNQDAAIHEEVNRLPEKYRAPLVLCDLEGRTHQEAARSLGWPIGTVKSRQSHGRGLLRDRLVRRGVGLAGTGAAFESMTKALVAATGGQVSERAVTAAMGLTVRGLPGTGASAHVLTLTRGVLHAMLLARLRIIAVAALRWGLPPVGRCLCGGSQEPVTREAPPAAKPAVADLQRKNIQDKAAAPRAADAAVQLELKAQRFATRKAKLAFEVAKLQRELAEVNAGEYKEVTYPRYLAAAEGEEKLARTSSSGPVPNLRKPSFSPRKCSGVKASRVLAELTFKKAQFTHEQAAEKKRGCGAMLQRQDDRGPAERGRESHFGPVREGGDMESRSGQGAKAGARLKEMSK